MVDAFVSGELTLVLSELALRELETATEGVRKVVGRVPEAHIEPLSLSPEADALHIALATVSLSPRTKRRSTFWPSNLDDPHIRAERSLSGKSRWISLARSSSDEDRDGQS